MGYLAAGSSSSSPNAISWFPDQQLYLNLQVLYQLTLQQDMIDAEETQIKNNNIFRSKSTHNTKNRKHSKVKHLQGRRSRLIPLSVYTLSCCSCDYVTPKTKSNSITSGRGFQRRIRLLYKERIFGRALVITPLVSPCSYFHPMLDVVLHYAMDDLCLQ